MEAEEETTLIAGGTEGKPLKILQQSSPGMGTKAENNLHKWNSMAQ